MNSKKFWITFVVVFVVLEITSYIIHGVILDSAYSSEPLSKIFRSKEEMGSMMWVMWLMDLIWSYFFVFFFVKGYENKGLGEGLRFGLYIAIFWNLVWAYGNYVIFPLPYGIVLQWFIYGLVQILILGAVASLVYKPEAQAAE